MNTLGEKLRNAGLAEAVELAKSQGYEVVFDWLDGCGGGPITENGVRWILIDDMLPVDEQLNTIRRVLCSEPRRVLPRPASLPQAQPLITRRRAA
jgi:hypothetical protein